METKKLLGDIQLNSWLAYPASIALAAMGAYGGVAIAMPIVALFDTIKLALLGWTLFCIIPGFCGVYLGALCFTPPRRLFGSICLVVLGTGAFLFTFGSACIHRGLPFPYDSTALTAIGGTLAVGVHFWRIKTSQKLAG